MERIVRKVRQVAGGYLLEIEVTQAYTDGRSRFDEVFVADGAVRGKTPAQKLQAVYDALSDDLADVRGTAVSAPAATKDIIEDRMVALYEDWQRWKATRAEAQARSLAAGVITALTNREDAAWAKYVQSIQVWRNA